MDRKVIFAVAGSGKTTLLVERLDEIRRFLVVTYTDKNTDNIKNRVLKKFGYHPKNITVLTYFEFLMAICYRPLLSDKVKARYILWNMPDQSTLKYPRSNQAFYMNAQHDLYHNRIARLCMYVKDEISERIAKYFDCFYYDEVQDLNGHDLDLMYSIIPHTIEALFVGDFFQHTYSTSLDGKLHKNLYENYVKYKKCWSDAGYNIDEKTLSNSYRCSKTVCDFVRDKIGIEIYSHDNRLSEIREIKTEQDADAIITDGLIPKLFYQEAHKYMCFAMNWGESKGLDDFNDVCIILNKSTLNAFYANELHKMAESTRNKLYVACTRAKRNLYFVPHYFLEKYRRDKH